MGLVVITASLGGAVMWRSYSLDADHVSSAERMARQAAFAELRDFPLVSVPQDEAVAALAQMQLEQEDRAALEGLIRKESGTLLVRPDELLGSRGPVRLVRMTLWDTHREDGDVIALVSAGFRQEIMLTRQKRTIVLPLDESLSVQIVGVLDGGGGGITYAVGGANQQLMMPVMRTGQVLSLPIAR